MDADKAPEKLRQLGDLAHILPQIIEYAAKSNPTQRAGLAPMLKIDPDVLRSLIAGREGISDLIAEAHKMGIVFDEDMIRKAAEASSQINVASRIIDGELKSAFIEIAPTVAGFATKLADAAAAMADMVRGAKDAIRDIRTLGGLLDGVRVPKVDLTGGAFNFAPGVGRGMQELQERGAEDRGSAGLHAGIAAAQALLKAPVKPLQQLAADAATGHSDAASVTKDVQDKLAAATKDLATAMAALTGDIFAHADLEKDAIEAERVKQQADLAEVAGKTAASKSLSAAAKKTLDAQLAIASAKIDEAAQAKKDKIDRDAANKLQASLVADAEAVDQYYAELAPLLEQRAKTLKEAQAIEAADLLHRQKLARQKLASDNATAEAVAGGAQSASQSAALVASQAVVQEAQRQDLAAKQTQALEAQRLQLLGVAMDTQKQTLDHELSLAETQDQRRVIMLRLLALDEERQRLTQQAIIDAGTTSAAEKEIARATLQQMKDLHAGKVSDIAQQTEGPAAAFARQGRQALGGDNLQGEFVGAIGDLNSGLAEAIVNAKSLGEVGSKVFDQLAADLIKNMLEASEAALIGAPTVGGKGGSGFLGLVSTFLPLIGLAHGGTVPGSGNSDSVPALLTPGERVIPKGVAGKYGVLLDHITRGGHVVGLAGGGLVGLGPPAVSPGGGRGLVNLSVTSHNDMRGAVGDDSLDRRLARAEQNTATRVLDTVRRAMPSWQILNTYERG